MRILIENPVNPRRRLTLDPHSSEWLDKMAGYSVEAMRPYLKQFVRVKETILRFNFKYAFTPEDMSILASLSHVWSGRYLWLIVRDKNDSQVANDLNFRNDALTSIQNLLSNDAIFSCRCLDLYDDTQLVSLHDYSRIYTVDIIFLCNVEGLPLNIGALLALIERKSQFPRSKTEFVVDITKDSFGIELAAITDAISELIEIHRLGVTEEKGQQWLERPLLSNIDLFFCKPQQIMYDAYAAEEVVSKLPFDATSIASFDKKDKLLIGSRQGHLLTCHRSAEGKKLGGFEYQVCRTFEKRAISELKVVESLDIILCLTDGQLTAHEANEPFKLLDTISKYRPITSFAFHVNQETNLLQVAISSKRRLYLFKWLLNNFDEYPSNTSPLCFVDSALQMAWTGPSNLVMAVKDEYLLLRVLNDEDTREASQLADEESDVGKSTVLCQMGNRPVDAPLICQLTFKTKLPPKRTKELIGLGKDNTIMFFGRSGYQSKDLSQCRFSDVPLSIVYDAPYLVSVLPKGIVEIRSIQPPLLIQKIRLDNVFTLCPSNQGNIYAGSDHFSWRLCSAPLVKKNVEFLEKEKHFDLAIQLAEENDSLLNKATLVDIKRRMALEMFIKKDFRSCFNIHMELKTDVRLVMNMFPQLVPEKFLSSMSRISTQELTLFDPSVNLAENERRAAILELGQYISARRMDEDGPYRKLIEHYKNFKEGKKDNLLSTNTLKKYESMLEFMDTCLLKCWALVNPKLLPMLLRLTNGCIISETEKDLFSKGLFAELLIFYECKKMHRKALELLKREFKNEESPLFGVERLANYLQKLGQENAREIYELSILVLAENVELGVKVFTAEGEQPRNLDVEEILEFLRKNCVAAIIPYLEHVIFEWHEQRPKFHEELAEEYIRNINNLMKDYVHALADEEFRTRGGEEEGELGVMRKKLIHFLENSKEYSPEKVLLLLDDNLLEERAIVYGRLKKHDEALFIYCNILMDFGAAERYCSLYYDPVDAFNKNVYSLLFKAYASPHTFENAALNFKPKFIWRQPKINVTEALKVLRKHASEVDTAVFEVIKNKATQTSLLLAVTQLAQKNREKTFSQMQQRKVVIHESTICHLCKKTISNSAFVRLPTSQLAHYYCFKSHQEAPPS
ncbi:vacuolar sorting protein 39 domain 1 domain-containing protein [Ditylenchus destructor]|uniref:Vacuolar sorting protein 39 domain 1 domain-containing protein n=1 Tax=Ditylenchus destructor TaxID=166010 RepID=A0AAD4R2X1_9BILA|nr:vacuolar sorting protein 39 domain 1 domain-containing protein [Ditylenchus destructor]